MAGNSINVNGKVDLKVNVQAESAKQQIANLQKSLQQVANIELNVRGDSLTEEIQNASQAALQLQSHLNNAINVKTNNLDFSKFSASLNMSMKNGGKSLQEYSDALIALGPQGKTAFMNLANAIAASEVPLKKTNKLLDTTWDNLKKTIGWQFSSSVIHGFMGSIQQAIGYAQDLNKSLTDIRIVTGASKEQMADFAKEANTAAKKLSTTTTEYTKASLIYYQQGLSESEIKARAETTIKMANATGTSAQKVSDQMTAIWNNYDNGTKSLTHYADVMTALGAATASSTDEIAQGLQKFASISDTVGLSYEYAASALATVTATSRESADVVGNSFKTLFSRIQGLQLGETLEDGTDLNKYSNALASVGINIKDASGQLKDMDIILDEMGASWMSLARDEKMALAQTVAGVRQYTQLMTLMENWDYFKENLNVANNSQGTLDTQASIYAESWMAASDRVRASWEGVWDSLINSDSFITVLDGISGLIGMLDTMVESFGGAGGTIALFGGLLGKAFTPQITKTIEDTAYNLKMLTPKGRQSVIDQRKNLIESLRGSIADAGTFGMGDTETRVARENLARAAEQSANRAEWRSRLNEQELMEADFLEARIAKNRNTKMQLAADIDAAEEANTNLVEDRLNGGRTKFGKWLQGSSADDAQAIIDNADKEIAALEAREKAIKKGKETFKDGESYSDLHKQRDEWGRKKASAINLQNRAETREQTMNNAAMMGSNFLNIFGLDFWNKTSIDQDTKKMKMDYKGLQSKMKAAAAKAGFKDLNPINEMIDEVFKEISESDNSIDKNRGKIRALGERIARSAAEEILAGITDETTRQQAQEYMDNIFKAETGREALTSYDTADDRDSARLKEMGEKKPSKIETAVDIADNAMMIVAAAQAANAFAESLTLAINNSGSFADVLAGGISMLSTGLFSGLQMFKTLSTFMVDPVTAAIISIASVALPALISGITGFNEASQELENERNEKVLEETDALKERLDTNKQLVKSMNDAISSYESTMKSYKKGESSYEDTVAARQDLINNIQSSSEDYSPEVISKILAGDTTGATKQIYEDRSREIGNNLSQFQRGQEAAGNLMGDAAEQGALGDWFWGGEINTGLINRYHGDTASGEAIDSFINYLHTISTDYAHLTEGINGINISDVAEDPESFIQFYDDAKKGLQYLQEQDLIDNDGYRSLESFINKNAANVEQYKKYQSDMTNLQAEKAAIDKEFYNIDALAKQDGVTALKKYDQMRKDLIEANSGIEGFEEALDQYLNQVSQLKDTSQGNLPAVYKALQGAQEATKRRTFDGLTMDTMINLYNGLGNDMFNINFEAMTTNALSQLQKAIEMVQANGEELTMENIIKAVVVLEDGGVNSELMSILQAAQALADANAIKAKIEIVSDFDPEKDLFDPKKRQEFLDAYNDIMGNKEGDADYIDFNDLSLMTSDEIADLQFRSTQEGRSQEISGAQGRVEEWSGIKENLEAEQANSRNAVSAAEEAMFGDAAEGADASLLAENAELISEYGDLRNRLKEGLYTAGDGKRMSEIVDTLSEAGLTDNAVYDKLSPQAHAITYADQISEYAQLQKFKEQGIATDSDLTRMQGIQNELKGTGIIDDSGNLSQFYAENIKGINGIAEARDNLSGVNERLATATSELSSAEMDAANSHLAQQELMQQEAEYYNVDMDAVRAYAAELERTGQVQQREKENIQDYHNRLLRLALDYQENTEGLAELQDAYKEYKAALKSKDTIAETNAMNKMRTAISKITKLPINKISKDFMKWAKDSGTLEKALRGDSKAIKELEKQASKVRFNDLTTTFGQAVKAVADSKDDLIATADDMWKGIEEALGKTKVGDILNDIVTSVGNAGEMLNDLFANTFAKNLAENGGDAAQAWADTCDAFAENGIIPEVKAGEEATIIADNAGTIMQYRIKHEDEGVQVEEIGPWNDPTDSETKIKGDTITFSNGRAGGGSSGGGGGGGGGGGAKEPKKVAQTRRSQVVKRYKNIDAKRSINKGRRKNMEDKTSKLYGEAKITNLEKENKLLEEGLKLNRKKSEEAMKNLKIDQEAVVAMSQKYGYEVKFDSEGNLENYEEILGDLYDQLHALEADNLMDEAEEKVKEEIEIKREEIEGAIEDLEDTISQLQELNDEYEEMIAEMHENNLEKITYKLEFELELNELDTEWNDFLLEQIDDDFTQAAAIMDLVTDKAKTATENIEHYKQSVTDLIENIENDPNRSLITGYIEDGVLTEDEAEIIKEAYSGIIEELNNLAEAKTTAEELLVSIFEGYSERIDMDMTALEHYSTLMEHFGNVVDIVGQKQLGLSNEFLENLSNMRAAQANDIISSSKTNLEALYQVRADAEAELEKAREEGRTNDIDYWQERVNEANTAIQEAAEGVATALEESLTTIAEAFDASMQRIIDTFNDAIYAFGGLEGLSTDYSSIQEDVSLMAADYQKIYELSKLTRNINKTLNDSNIIAGKQKMLDLQKEINELQANGVEMSQYDLEYLQAKYELRLAEIELENAQNNKDTVRLSKDSEGNWSYVYTQNMDALDKAQQKYEDALYNMQKMSYEYIDEMSQRIVQVSQDMMEEISNIDKSQFKNEIELMEEVNRIKAKYANSLGLSEDELNKALENNKELYANDWQAYNLATGYGLSEASDWIDSYRESTLGSLLDSESDLANYVINFQDALDELTQSLRRVATDYYFNTEAAFAASGMTKVEFASYVAQNSQEIKKASNDSKKNIEEQTKNLVDEFGKQAEKVTTKQTELKTAIDTWGPYLKEIKDLLEESAKVTKDQQGKDATYTYKEAADLFNSKYSNGLDGFAGYTIEMNKEGVWSKGVDAVKNEILTKHSEAKTDEEKKYYADMYTWLTSYILPYTTSLDTGGYTGEWGNSGKLAMLHEKELVLNADDTSNFLNALQLSYDVINSMIEMNAKASSMGFGNLMPSSFQENTQTLEQQVMITAEFPNATNHDEIEEAFNNLINTASQYANRYNL